MSNSRSNISIAELPVPSAARCGNQRLRPPRSLVPLIDRPFLLSMLLDGLERQMVVVHAPAGYGKTELLAAAYHAVDAAADASRGSFAHRCWLTLSPVHRDPEKFLADLALALELEQSDGIMAPWDLEALLQTIGHRPDRTVLFLDELDATATPAVQPLIDQLFRESPENLSIACASRSKPALPLSRLRLRGLAMEIGAKHLAFSRAEIRRVMGKAVSGDDIGALDHMTRGWPALVRLAAALWPELDADERDAMLRGDHRDLFAYVDEVLLQGMPPSLRHALRVCAILDEFPAELVQELSAAEIDQKVLDSLEAFAPAIERNETRPGWYKLHPVVRAYFAAVLAAQPGECTEEFHRRAAVWFSARRFVEKAVVHAVRGRDFALAAETIRSAGGVELFLRAGHTMLERLIDELPRDVILDSPGLSLCYSLVLAKRGQIAEASKLIAALKSGPLDQYVDFETIPGGTLDHIDGMVDIYRDDNLDSRQIERLEITASSFGPQRTWERGWIYNHLCIAYTRRGDLEPARLSALAALSCYREERAIYAQIFMLLHLGLVSTLSGNFSAALTFSRDARDLIQCAHWSDRNLEAIASIPLAEVLYQQGEVTLVEQMLGASVTPMTRGEGWVDLYVRMFSVLALCRMRLSGLDTAIAVIDRADEVAAERDLPRLRIAAHIMRMDLFVRAGLLESAEHIVELLTGTRYRDEQWWTWREENDFCLATARLRIAQQRPAEALADIERVMSRAKDNGSGYYRLFSTVLATRALWDLGRHARALHSLQSAIALARSHEAIQPFVDEGLAFASTVRAIIRRCGLGVFSPDAIDFISRIVGDAVRKRQGRTAAEAVGRGKADEKQSNCDGLFSMREHEVLLHLSDGKSNKEIARDLDLSEATVKFHLKNIFAKLGVSRRAMALAVAKRLNIG